MSSIAKDFSYISKLKDLENLSVKLVQNSTAAAVQLLKWTNKAATVLAAKCEKDRVSVWIAIN